MAVISCLGVSWARAIQLSACVSPNQVTMHETARDETTAL